MKIFIFIVLFVFGFQQNVKSQTCSLKYFFYQNRKYHPLKKVIFDSTLKLKAYETYFQDTTFRSIIYLKNYLFLLNKNSDTIGIRQLEKFTNRIVIQEKNYDNDCYILYSFFTHSQADDFENLFGFGDMCKVEVKFLLDSFNRTVERRSVSYLNGYNDTVIQNFIYSKQSNRIHKMVIRYEYNSDTIKFNYDKRYRLKEVKSYFNAKIEYKKRSTIIRLYQSEEKVGQLKVVSSIKSISFEDLFISGILKSDYYGTYQDYWGVMVW